MSVGNWSSRGSMRLRPMLSGDKIRVLVAILAHVVGLSTMSITVAALTNIYPWLEKWRESESLTVRVPPPAGYKRVATAPGTFAAWLRHLPLKQGAPPVLLYNGQEKGNQDAHHAVVDIDVGPKNLQQCADAVIRFRAEYLYSRGMYDKIHFNFTSGDTAWLGKWFAGYRPEIKDNTVRWTRTMAVDSSYENFRRYLEAVFTYAGSYSLSRELQRVGALEEMRIGDVFIAGGFPDHAVIVVDLAANPATGKKVFLLAQSFMPAQDIHLLINRREPKISPWYELEFGDSLDTPEWRFDNHDLLRFR